MFAKERPAPHTLGEQVKIRHDWACHKNIYICIYKMKMSSRELGDALARALRRSDGEDVVRRMRISSDLARCIHADTMRVCV